MEANDHPLGRLIGPLQYACEDNFAKLPQVRGLRQLVEGAFASATQQGVVRGTGPLLQRHFDAIDAPSLEVRKKALCEILNRLRRSGVELPEPLAQMVPASNRLPPARSRIAPGARKPLSAEGPRATKNGAGLDLEGTRKPDARAEARLLSIAPRSGPLAAPLRNAGWRLNPRLIGALNRRGLRKLGDVLFLLPRCYEDRRRISDVARLVPGTRGVTVAIVRAIQESPRRYRRGGVFRAVLGDGSGTIAATYFQTGPWLKARFPIGKRLLISGEVRASSFGREIAHPEVEPAEDLESSSIHFNRIVPIYPGFERHEQRALRELAFRVRDEFAKFLDDPLPDGLRTRLGLLPLQRALRDIHFPAEDADLAAFNDHQSACHRRLAFDEFFFLQLGMLLKRQGVKSRQ